MTDEDVYVCDRCGAQYRTIVDAPPPKGCYECSGEWYEVPDRLTDVDLNGIPPTAKVFHIADWMFFMVKDEPYGTPASDTPWFQKEGYVIADAIRRHTRLAIWDVLDPVNRDGLLVKLPEGQTEFAHAIE